MAFALFYPREICSSGFYLFAVGLFGSRFPLPNVEKALRRRITSLAHVGSHSISDTSGGGIRIVNFEVGVSTPGLLLVRLSIVATYF